MEDIKKEIEMTIRVFPPMQYYIGVDSANGFFIPKKHTVMSYRVQQRLSKKLKNKKRRK